MLSDNELDAHSNHSNRNRHHMHGNHNNKDSKYGNEKKFEFTGEEGVKQERIKTLIELKKQMD